MGHFYFINIDHSTSIPGLYRKVEQIEFTETKSCYCEISDTIYCLEHNNILIQVC